jgi:hypothetical protein
MAIYALEPTIAKGLIEQMAIYALANLQPQA